jgi:hypothetical protein
MNVMHPPPALTAPVKTGRRKIKIALLFGDPNNATIFSIYSHTADLPLESLDQSHGLSPDDATSGAAILLTDLVPPGNLGEHYRYWRQRRATPAAIVISVGDNRRPCLCLRLLFGSANIRNYPLTASGIMQLRLDAPLILKTAREVSSMPATRLSNTSTAAALSAAISERMDWLRERLVAAAIKRIHGLKTRVLSHA